jgi:hypothetical protein
MIRERGTLKFLPVMFAVLTFALTEFAAAFPASTEKIYSRGIYPVIASVLSPVSNLLPFSVDDIFYISLIFAFVLFTILVILRKISIKKYLLMLINTIAVVYTAFYWLWGFNYFRDDLYQRLKLREQKASTENFREALDFIIAEANNNNVDTFTLSKKEINTLIERSYKDMSPFLNINYPQGKREPKVITFSMLFAKATISGYFGPFFNEIHINKYLLPVEYPWTLAHEKAHQFGVTSEAEANFYAWLTCSNSTDKQIKYTGSLNLLFYFLYEAKKLPDYSDIVSKLDKGVRNDITKIIEHWSGLRDKKIEEVAEKANDTYLKTNKVEKGIEDYDGVVKYVTDYLTQKKK